MISVSLTSVYSWLNIASAEKKKKTIMRDVIENRLLKETFVSTSDAGQPGTEIFNMPASTTAGMQTINCEIGLK